MVLVMHDLGVGVGANDLSVMMLSHVLMHGAYSKMQPIMRLALRRVGHI